MYLAKWNNISPTITNLDFPEIAGVPFPFLTATFCGVFRSCEVADSFGVWRLRGTLPKTNIAIENPPFWWYLLGNMGIFMGELLLVSGRAKLKKIGKNGWHESIFSHPNSETGSKEWTNIQITSCRVLKGGGRGGCPRGGGGTLGKPKDSVWEDWGSP